MTIPSYDNRRSYAGDGSTTVFAFPPPFTTNTDLVVQIQAADGTITTKVLGTDYTVTGAGNPAGGNVTMTVAPALTTTLIIYRDVPLTQSVDLQDGGPLPASTINKALDRITMWGQRLKEQVIALGTLATQTAAGLMSAADKLKLDGIQAGAQVNAVTSVAGKTGAVTLVKGDVGLGNVDNTSDLNKPISTATQTALNLKANTSALAAVAFSGAKADVGLGNVDNTSDANKPVSTAQQTALDTKLTKASNLGDLPSPANARTNLGLVIGTDVQAYDADLAAIAALAPAQGDVLYHNGTAWARLAAGTSGQFLRTAGAAANPSWATIAGGGDLLAANNLSELTPTAATARANIGAGTGNGTVTSVGLSAPSGFSVASSPITGSGTLALTYAAGYQGYTSAEATKLSGIASGAQPGTVTSVGMSVPSFLSVSGSPVTTSGTFAVSLSGTELPAANGGTGQTSYTVGDILYADTTSTLAKLADIAGGNVLRSGGVGVAPSWGKVGLTTHVTGTLPVANGGTNLTALGTALQVLRTNAGGTAMEWATLSTASTWPTGTLYGLTLSQASTTTVGVAVGGCANEDGGTAYNLVLGSAITKSLSTWAAGTGNGGLDTGTIAASTWYHVHLIRKDSDGSIDALLSLSATAPTMPSGYTARRRLGSILTNGSSQVTAFLQVGDRFVWSTPVTDVSVVNPGTSAVTRTLSVPSGVVVAADIVAMALASAGTSVGAYLSALAVTDSAVQDPSTTSVTLPINTARQTADTWGPMTLFVFTNTSSQIRSRLSASGSSTRLAIITQGWVDTRGKL